MWRVFNNGLGMILVVSADQTLAIQEELFRLGEKAFLIGEIVARPNRGRRFLLINLKKEWYHGQSLCSMR